MCQRLAADRGTRSGGGFAGSMFHVERPGKSLSVSTTAADVPRGTPSDEEADGRRRTSAPPGSPTWLSEARRMFHVKHRPTISSDIDTYNPAVVKPAPRSAPAFGNQSPQAHARHRFLSPCSPGCASLPLSPDPSAPGVLTPWQQPHPRAVRPSASRSLGAWKSALRRKVSPKAAALRRTYPSSAALHVAARLEGQHRPATILGNGAWFFFAHLLCPRFHVAEDETT